MITWKESYAKLLKEDEDFPTKLSSVEVEKSSKSVHNRWVQCSQLMYQYVCPRELITLGSMS